MILAMFATVLSMIALAWLASIVRDFSQRNQYAFLAGLDEDSVPGSEPVMDSVASSESKDEEEQAPFVGPSIDLTSAFVIRDQPEIRHSALDRVEVRVVGYDVDWKGTLNRVSRLVCVAFLRNGRVLIRIEKTGVNMLQAGGKLTYVECPQLFLDLVKSMRNHQETDPIGFLEELMERFPQGSYAAAVGAPFAVPYYREAA